MRWNGASWSPIPGIPSLGAVRSLVVFDDGSGPALFVGGFFREVDGAPGNYIAKWNGSSWARLGSGTNNTVFGLAVIDDGSGPRLYAGGGFTSAGGSPANGVARWDGTTWTGLDGKPGSTIALLDGRKIGEPLTLFAGGGYYTMTPGMSDDFVARWQGCDTYGPEILCPDAVHAKDLLAPGEIVHFTVTATDNSDPAPVVVCTPASGSFFPPGRTLVTCTATDASGNSRTRTFPVLVGKAQRR